MLIKICTKDNHIVKISKATCPLENVHGSLESCCCCGKSNGIVANSIIPGRLQKVVFGKSLDYIHILL